MGVHSSVGVAGAGAYLLGLLFLGAGGGFVTEGFLTNHLLAGELSVDLGLGLTEVLSGRRTARERLRASQLEQELGTLIRRRRLRERAPEVGRGAVGSALPEGRPSGPPQRLDDPLVAAGGYGKEVGGHLLDWRAPLCEQSRGPLVQDLPLPGRRRPPADERTPAAAQPAGSPPAGARPRRGPHSFRQGRRASRRRRAPRRRRARRLPAPCSLRPGGDVRAAIERRAIPHADPDRRPPPT